MWRMRRRWDGEQVVLSISGRIDAENLEELQKAISTEKKACQTVEIDLEGVKLVGQQTVTFFAGCEASGIRLRNCPAYIREWMSRENCAQNPNSES